MSTVSLGSQASAEAARAKPAETKPKSEGDKPQPKLPPELEPKRDAASHGSESTPDDAADSDGRDKQGGPSAKGSNRERDRASGDDQVDDAVESGGPSRSGADDDPEDGDENIDESPSDAIDAATDSDSDSAPGGTAKPAVQPGVVAAVAKAAAPPEPSVSSGATSDKARPIESYGPISVGHPHAGFLVNAVPMPRGPHWVLTVPAHGYGTQETVDSLSRCIDSVSQRLPNTPPVMLGSISAEHGGYLPPHRSHRTGRDADVYFFRTPGAKWVEAAKQDDIDYPRTWLLLRCFVTETDTDFILIDRKVQGWLEEFALGIGEDPEWIERIFHDKPPYHRSVIRHVPGHVAHMHVRFVSAEARRRGVALYDRLVQGGSVERAYRRSGYLVKKGDTLIAIAKANGTSVKALRAANNITGSLIRVGQKLNIDKPVEIRDARAPVIVPPRQLPKSGAGADDVAAPASDGGPRADGRSHLDRTALGSMR